MKALSIRQPWIWAIMHAGKRVENRAWKHAPSYRGPLLLHAAAGCTRSEYVQALHWMVLGPLAGPHRYPGEALPREAPELANLPRGGIVGRAVLVDVLPRGPSSDPWRDPEQLGLVLADIEPLPFYRCKGALGFFDVDMSQPPEAEPLTTSGRGRIGKPGAQGRLF